MEPGILLAQLRSLLERAPDLNTYEPKSMEHQTWLAQAYALVSRWDRPEATMLKVSAGFLATQVTRPGNISNIFGAIHRAIADLELIVPADAQVSFGAGDVYDFFKALNKVISSAESSIFIVDPYLDISVFDQYLISRGSDVHVRLLLSKNADDLVPAANKYRQQYGDVIEMRKSNALHDRVVFIDGFVCWLLGQSVKDAAKAKPTYLVQLPPDVVATKLRNYEEIWIGANEL